MSETNKDESYRKFPKILGPLVPIMLTRAACMPVL
jgi:hypothetical protein